MPVPIYPIQANLPYILFVSAYNNTMLFLFCVIDTNISEFIRTRRWRHHGHQGEVAKVVDPYRKKEREKLHNGKEAQTESQDSLTDTEIFKVPALFESLNANGLAVFLVVRVGFQKLLRHMAYDVEKCVCSHA